MKEVNSMSRSQY